jgi:glycosyltransferase 2 family protein
LDQYLHQKTIDDPVETQEAAGKSGPRRNRILGLLQAAIGLGALLFLFSRTDLGDLSRAIARVDLKILSWAVLLNLAMVFMMAVRWRILLRVKYPKLGNRLLFRQYLVGLFFNLFTPGATGGDLSRLLSIGEITGDRSFVFATLVVERLAGLCGLLLAGLGGIYIGSSYLDNPALYYSVAVIMLLGLALSLVIFNANATRRMIDLISRLEAKLNIKIISGPMSRLVGELAVFGRRPGTIAASILLTLGIRTVWVFSCWIVSRALGLELPFSILMAFIAIVDIARMAPISPPNGLGVREYLLVLLLGQISIAPAEAILFSLIAHTLLMLNGLIGGLLYTARGAFRSVKL